MAIWRLVAGSKNCRCLVGAGGLLFVGNHKNLSRTLIINMIHRFLDIPWRVWDLLVRKNWFLCTDAANNSINIICYSDENCYMYVPVIPDYLSQFFHISNFMD